LKASPIVDQDQGAIVRENPALIVLPIDWAIDHIEQELEESEVTADRLLDDILGEPLTDNSVSVHHYRFP
jgi:hypothetical protein